MVLVLIAGRDWLAAPIFLLLPGVGMGWAGVRGMGLVAHTVFAVGMWVKVVGSGWLAPNLNSL